MKYGADPKEIHYYSEAGECYHLMNLSRPPV